MANDERGLLMTGDDHFRAEIAERADEVRAKLELARRTALDPKDAEAVGQVEDMFEQWATAREAEFDLYGRDADAAVELALGENRDLPKEYEAALGEAVDEASGDLRETVSAETRAARKVLTGALLLLAALAVAAAVWLERSTRRRLSPLVARLRSLDEHCVSGLSRGLEAIAEGNLTLGIQPVTTPLADGPRDRIGEASTTTNALIGKPQTALASYNAMREQLGGLIGEISGSSRTLSAASDEMASTSDEAGKAVGVVAAGAERAEDGVATMERTRDAFEHIGAAIEEMGARIGEIAGAVQRIAADAQRAEGDIGEVASVAEESSAAAEQVSASTQQTSASTQEIAASAQALSDTAAQLDRLVARSKVSA